MFGFLLVALVVVLMLRRRRRRAPVSLLYPSQARIWNGEAIFHCGCRFSLQDSKRRALCHAHKAIISAEVAP